MILTGKKLYVAAILFFQSLQAFAKDYPSSLFDIYSDGVSLNTRSIQFAIDYIHDQGGGRLVFDVGRYLTGSIHLKSGVTLHLAEGAVLLGVLNPFDYDREGFSALIFARDQQNIGISGKGIIEGQGQQLARNITALVHKGLIKDAFRHDRPEVEDRPMLIYFRSCENILVRGVTMRNSAAWVQTYDLCKNIWADSITVDSRAYWNNDGIDIVDCDSVAVTNSYIDAADDGICLKSHDMKGICQRVLISNCTIRSSANAIKFGTASIGGFSNIRIVNNKVFDTYRSALAFETVDGGYIRDVQVDSLQAINTGNAVFMRLGERIQGRKGKLENIHINHLSVEIAAGKADAGYDYEGPPEDMPRNISPAIVIAGLPGAVIRDIIMTNIELKHPGGANPFLARVIPDDHDSLPEKAAVYPEFSMFRELPAWGIYIRHAQDIQFNSINLSCTKDDYRTAVVLEDVHHASFASMNIKEMRIKRKLYTHYCSDVSFK